MGSLQSTFHMLGRGCSLVLHIDLLRWPWVPCHSLHTQREFGEIVGAVCRQDRSSSILPPHSWPWPYCFGGPRESSAPRSYCQNVFSYQRMRSLALLCGTCTAQLLSNVMKTSRRLESVLMFFTCPKRPLSSAVNCSSAPAPNDALEREAQGDKKV